jgi:hypothetical protein
MKAKVLISLALQNPGVWTCATAHECITCQNGSDGVQMIAAGPNLSAVEPGRDAVPDEGTTR